jgi:putative ABC transport system permease protein
VRRGEHVELATPLGPRTFRIEGTFVDYFGSLDLGSIVVDFRYLESYWRDSLANLFQVWVEPGASTGDVRSQILTRLGRSQGVYVLTASDFQQAVQEMKENFFAAVWGLQLVAALVGVIGVINAQAAAVVDRGREITVLQAIGVRESAIRRMVVIESGSIGLVGGLVGAALGLMLGAQIVLVSLRLVTGWQMKMVIPGVELLGGLALVGVIAALAGYVPARLATRQARIPVAAD